MWPLSPWYGVAECPNQRMELQPKEISEANRSMPASEISYSQEGAKKHPEQPLWFCLESLRTSSSNSSFRSSVSRQNKTKKSKYYIWEEAPWKTGVSWKINQCVWKEAPWKIGVSLKKKGSPGSMLASAARFYESSNHPWLVQELL